jgi:hypothetical protein
MGTGSQKPRGSQGSRDFEQDELFAGDPSVSPGLPRPEGWRVRMPDGAGAWDKTGPLDTDWTPVGPGGGGVSSVVSGSPNVTVTTVAGVASVAVADVDPPAGADWNIARMRVYAVDPSRPDDSGAGFADMAGTSAGDYATACAAAGAVAKKTIAGLAAIFPKVGNGRLVEIVIAAGDYHTGAGIETVLSGVVGYAPGCPVVRGTVTDATAGSVKFAGTVADVTMDGAVTVTGLNAPGYNCGSGTSATTLNNVTKVGGAGPALPNEPNPPDGWRVRFDSATVTAALRNACRQICNVQGGDTVTLQSALPAVPAGGDVFYIEQAGVILPGFTTPTMLSGPPNGSLGWQWSGLRSDASWIFNDLSILFSMCGCFGFGCNGRELATIRTSQSIFHPVLGTVIVGGGMAIDTVATLSNVQLQAEGLITRTDLIVTGGTNLVWGVGCAARSVKIAGFNGNTSNDDTSTVPNIGAPSSAPPGIPRIFGGAAGDGLTIDGSKLRIGQISFNNIQSGSAIRPRGRCDLFIEPMFAPSANIDNYGLDLRNASCSTIQVFGTGNLPVGALGEILYAGGSNVIGPNGLWSHLVKQDMWDTNGNHLVDYDVSAYAASISPSVVFVELQHPLSSTVHLGLYRYGSAGPLFTAAQADTIANATGLVGTLLTQPDCTQALLGSLDGYKALEFDAAASPGAVVYLSASVPGLATTTVPPLSLTAAKLRLGVAITGGTRAVVRMAAELVPVLADGLP